jgi:hypothetical protein
VARAGRASMMVHGRSHGGAWLGTRSTIAIWPPVGDGLSRAHSGGGQGSHDGERCCGLSERVRGRAGPKTELAMEERRVAATRSSQPAMATSSLKLGRGERGNDGENERERENGA